MISCQEHTLANSYEAAAVTRSRSGNGCPTLIQRLEHFATAHTLRSIGRQRLRVRTLRVRAKRQEEDGSLNKQEGGLDPLLEQAVPSEQRPVNELAELKQSQLCSWATLPAWSYGQRLMTVWLAAVVVITGPVAYYSFDPTREPLAFCVAAATGGLLFVATAVLRMYLGWAYVANRLLSATVEYEETGWYDGQVFVKPPEVLARDRLLGSYEVKPVMGRLKQSLVGIGGGLVVSSAAFLGVSNSVSQQAVPYGMTRAPRVVTPSGIIYSDRVRDLAQLADDDEAAQAEAEALGGVPGYCGDRFFRAFAGGQYCAKFDARRR